MAAEMFAAYVGLGPQRSLRKLAADFPNPSSKLRQLVTWSSKYGWQDRIKALAEDELEEAVELRRGIYLRILREYDRRTEEYMLRAAKLDEMHGVYDRVKPAEPTTGVNVGVGMTTVVQIIGPEAE
ncbi:MAG: hypothetical protein K0S99_142 [Thermomicrobiales bacterium]|nr:hypothetical protein [Thermomicrobiales bacterium]